MAKSKREGIKLKSTESNTYYHTRKNKTNTPGRIELRKYDPVIKRHCTFKETK